MFADDDAIVPVIVTDMGTMVTLVLVLVMGAASWGEQSQGVTRIQGAQTQGVSRIQGAQTQGVTRIQGVHPELRWARDIQPLHTQHSG